MKSILASLAIFTGIVLAQGTPGFDILSLDKSVDPCADFYRFSCGGWMKANPVPSDQARFGRFNELQDRNRTVLQNILEAASSNRRTRTALEQKIGDYFYACMDEKSINDRGTGPIKGELERIAGVKEKKALTDEVIHLYKVGISPFFFFGSDQDARDATQVIGDLDQPRLGMPDRDYYLKTDEKSLDLKKKYVEHVAKMFELLGSKPADAQKKAQAVLEMETELAKGSYDRVTRRDPEKMYHKMTVAELQSLAPEFDWVKFFAAVGAPKIESLNVTVPPAIRAFHALQGDRSLDDLRAFLTWNVVNAYAIYLPKAFDDQNFAFYGKALTGQQQQRPRWKRCVDEVDGNIPDALGKAFIDKTLGEEGKRRTLEMVGRIEKALEKDIQSLDWMTAKTKEQALQKLQAISNKIGSKEKWLDYVSVKIARDDLVGNNQRATEYEIGRQLGKIGKPVDKTDWSMSAPTVNAYYNPQENNVNFPAGILQPPFYDNKLDDAVNYGGIGAVIGHELTHGFDDQGRQFDAAGNLRDWWTEEDAAAFKERVACIVAEYGGFATVDDVKLNGQLTLGENTADNGGVRIAHMALMDQLQAKPQEKIDGFTPEQRFFLGYAQIWCENMTDEEKRRRANVDPHSRGEFRVNGVVSNSPEFRQAFGCKEGQPMVRAQSCRVW